MKRALQWPAAPREPVPFRQGLPPTISTRATLAEEFVSVALIDGLAFNKPEFIHSLAANPTLRVAHAQKEYVGILHNDLKAAPTRRWFIL